MGAAAGGQLLHAAYEAMGAVEGAIAARADETFARLTPGSRRPPGACFCSSSRPGRARRTPARRATSTEVGAAARPVVQALTEARLLVTGRDEATGRGDPRGGARGAHPALGAAARLAGPRPGVPALAPTAAGAPWPVGAHRARCRGAATRGPAGRSGAAGWPAACSLSPTERALIQESLALRERERTAREQRRRRLTWAAMGVAGVLLLLVFLAWWQRNEAIYQAAVATTAQKEAERHQAQAEQQRRLAEEQRQDAEARRQESERLRRIWVAQALAAQAPRQQDQHKQDERSVLLARQAYLFNQRSQGPVLDQVDEALRTVLSTPYFSVLLRGHGSLFTSVAFSPDGQRLAVGGGESTVRLWDVRRPAAPPTSCAPRGAGQVRRLQPGRAAGGHRLVGRHGAAVGRAPAGAPLGPPMRHEGAVQSAAFSPDGTRWLTASGRTARRGCGTRPAAPPLGQPMRHEGAVRSAAFSPDGKRVATASEDGTARLWDARHRRRRSARPAPRAGGAGPPPSARTGRGWSPPPTTARRGCGTRASGAPLGQPYGATRGRSSPSPSARTGSGWSPPREDGTARLWDAASGAELGQPHAPRGQWSRPSPSARTGSGWPPLRRRHGAAVGRAPAGAPLGQPMRHEGRCQCRRLQPGREAAGHAS